MKTAWQTLMALVAVSTVATAPGAPPPLPPSDREIANVAAFARMYGVVRYFYPSDTAAAIDWDRLAVVGVGRVRNAPDAARLRGALEALFQPLGPGIEIAPKLSRATEAPAEGPLVAWRYLGPGFAGGPYAAKRTHRGADIDGFVTMMQTRPAEALRGRTVRLRAKVRAAVRDANGGGALWLRVDRPNNGRGFFDNMSDRPVRDAEWREYAIEGAVADDASAVAFGAMSSGGVTADFDAVELSFRDSTGAWMPVAVEDAGFEAGADTGWQRAGTSRTAVVSRPSADAPEGKQFLRLGPSPEGAELFTESPPSPGANVDIDLGSGLKARVPLALTDTQARASDGRRSGLEALRRALAGVSSPAEDLDLDTRFADVVVAWNVFRHFYPYWPETGVRWDEHLHPNLRAVSAVQTRAAQADALRVLVAEAEDGHGGVSDPLAHERFGSLPVEMGMVEGQIAITASAVGADAPVGAVVSSIEGIPAARWLTDAMRLGSGTPQWRQVRILRTLTRRPFGTKVTLRIDDGSGTRPIALRYESEDPPAEKRPEPITEIAHGIWYVDLTRTTAAQLTTRLETLAGARGVVFDVRGYPTEAGALILPHLIEEPEMDRCMHVAKLVGPFSQSAGWLDLGWYLRPAAPRLAGRRVFMTDARAISYAESVMGYVADRKLATIVGSRTAGTNGNVASFTVPSGLRIRFTGLRVTGHDGQTPFHLVGVKPDVPVAPTIAGLRRGRDEVLERALAVIDAIP